MHDTVHRTYIENAEYVVSSVRELGLKPHPESRIMRMYRMAIAEDGFIEPSHPDFEIAVEAIRDLQVLAFVFDQAAKYSEDAKFKKLVRVALKDSALPQEDKTQSRGRDAQLELYIAAVCQSAGMLPVAREEPDVTCHTRGTKFGIAIKRLKSAANLEQHTRKAAKQISECRRIAGIIVLDTTFALNRDNERIKKPIPYEEFCRLHERALQEFIGHSTIYIPMLEPNIWSIIKNGINAQFHRSNSHSPNDRN